MFKCMSFWLHSFCRYWEGWDPVNRFNYTSKVAIAIVTPTDRPKSVRNRCVIQGFWWRFCVVMLIFGFFCGCRGFCHKTESDLFFFVLFNHLQKQQCSYPCPFLLLVGNPSVLASELASGWSKQSQLIDVIRYFD